LTVRKREVHSLIRWIAGILAFVYLALSAVVALFAALLGAFGCDESCDYASSSWEYDGDAWQWDAIIGLSTASLMIAIAATVLIVAFVRRFAWAALATHATVLVSAAVFVAQAEDALFAAIPLVLTIGAGSAALIVRTRGREEKVRAIANA
jgi:hypothetical protein